MSTVLTERETRYSGVGISEGVAIGRAWIIRLDARDAVPHYTLSESQVTGEKERLARALQQSAEELDELIEQVTVKLGAARANIFVAQKMMLEDPVILQEMYGIIENQLINAEAAVEKTLDTYESLLAEVDNAYIKERSSDIGEVRRRLVQRMTREHAREPQVVDTTFKFTEDRIIVAEELTPGVTMSLDTGHTVGFITERGGAASHAAILARALGIPAVSGVKNIHNLLSHGDQVLINGISGEVVHLPSERTLSLYPAARRTTRPVAHSIEPVPGLEVMANISLASDVDGAVFMRAEGVGLYRTEFEFLAASRVLTENEQYERYSYVVKAMADKPVNIRLLDLGGDKAAWFLDIPVEENPVLGFRGARLLQERTDLLITQARAIARASVHGPVSIIYPMIVDVEQFLRLREIVTQHTEDIKDAQLFHGIMFEVPSACLEAERMLEVADFGSIGSNDLVQYLFAVDRNNSLVSRDFNVDRPVFWSVLKSICDASEKTGKPVCLCGEIGGQPQYLPKLMDARIKTVSVSSRLIGLARMAARRVKTTSPQ